VAREKYQKACRKTRRRTTASREEKAEQQEQVSVAPPSSVSKRPGLIGAGKGSKGKTMGRLKQQMKTLGVVGGAN